VSSTEKRALLGGGERVEDGGRVFKKEAISCGSVCGFISYRNG
jgi:hypothetical protein